MEASLENHVESKPRPVPPSKPRPRVKPRPSAPGELPEAPPTQQRASPEPSTPTKKPVPALRPTPVPRKRGSAEVKVEEMKPLDEDQEEHSVEEAPAQSVKEAAVVPAPSESAEVGEQKVSTSQVAANEEQPISSPGHTQEAEADEVGGEMEPEEVVEKRKPSPEGSPEQGDSTYEDMVTVNGEEATDGEMETYEPMDYDRGSKSGHNQGTPQQEEEDNLDADQRDTEEELDAGSSNYVPMNPAATVQLESPWEQPSKSLDYEEVENTGGVDKESPEYEHPEGWGDTSRHSSMGFEPKAVLAPENTYDVLPPTRLLYTNGDASTGPLEVGGSTDQRLLQSPEVGRRSHSLSSCGSGSSGQLENLSMQARKGSKGMLSLSSSRSNSVTGVGADIASGCADVVRTDRVNSLEVRW